MGHAFIIEPKTYRGFENETEQMDKCKQWGLLSEKAAKIKEFVYKGYGLNIGCSVIGYVDDVTAVIQFENHQLHCIHPSYLKEMQASSFGQRPGSTAKAAADPSDPEQSLVKQSTKEKAAAKIAIKPDDKEKPSQPVKASKLELPVEKVKMSAIVKEFTTVPNHFAEEDDEVIIYEAVKIVESEAEVGLAWSSHSATLKKVGLELGDTITFEAKIAKKKLTKHPVPYKINNPSKIQQAE